MNNAEKIMTESKHCSTHLQLWKAIRDINIIPKFDWWQDLSPDPQILYAGQNIYRAEVRRDAIQYVTRNESEPSFGIVQSFYRHVAYSNLKVALVRVLEETEPEGG